MRNCRCRGLMAGEARLPASASPPGDESGLGAGGQGPGRKTIMKMKFYFKYRRAFFPLCGQALFSSGRGGVRGRTLEGMRQAREGGTHATRPRGQGRERKGSPRRERGAVRGKRQENAQRTAAKGRDRPQPERRSQRTRPPSGKEELGKEKAGKRGRMRCGSGKESREPERRKEKRRPGSFLQGYGRHLSGKESDTQYTA